MQKWNWTDFLVLSIIVSMTALTMPNAIANTKTKGTSPDAGFVCPVTGPGTQETVEDCPWAAVARLMQASAGQATSLTPILETYLPAFVGGLRADASHEAIKNLWGQSINFDELAKDTIVHPAILQTLAQELRIPFPSPRIVHAGMEHTYGYLFSTLKTSFGFKRARWVREDIAAGFGLSQGILGPLPAEGTLFMNISYFLGQIALTDDSIAQRSLWTSQEAVAQELRVFPYENLSFTRLKETIQIPTGGSLRTVELRTDLVPFIFMPETAGANTHLLVYSVLDSNTGRATLITAFPVASSFVLMVKNPDLLGMNQPIITRYNAFVKDVTGTSWKGTRQLMNR